MTLLDVAQLIQRYWKPITSFSLLCALCSCLLSLTLTPQRYDATTSITVADPSGNVSAASMLAVVNNTAQTEIAPYSASDSEPKASIQINSAAPAQSLLITVEARNEKESIDLANSIASNAADQAAAFLESLEAINDEELSDLSSLSNADDVAAILSGSILQNTLGTNLTFKFCSFTVHEASEAERTGLSAPVQAILFFLGGFALALIAVAIFANTRRPLKNRSEVETLAKAPVLNSAKPALIGDETWANVQFSTQKSIRDICLLPLKGTSAASCASSLSAAIEQAGHKATIVEVDPEEQAPCPGTDDEIVLYCCAPLSEGIAGAYCAHRASITILCCRTWKNTSKELCDTLRETALVKANVIGIILLKDH